jgi:phosphoribosylformylglycinamidine synthase
VILGPGEDAGIVRFTEHEGVRYAVVLAHESHNHPSQVLPFEGAATGIGGIVRDVYCMGADVIGVLDALRFGDPDGPRGDTVREIALGVVDGVAAYGNSLGVPNLGGDVCFHEGFDENCLVNVVALGVVREDGIIRSRAPGGARERPHDIVLVGRATDASGFGGAAFASAALEVEAAESRSAVQVPDPFFKRVLVVATQAVLERAREMGVEVGFKDLGAAGIGGASCEICAAGGVGADIELDRVPLGEPGLPPEVIVVSETQERYVWVIPPEFTPALLEIYNGEFALGDASPLAAAAVIGTTRADGRYRLAHKGEIVCDSPASTFTTPPRTPRISRARARPEPRGPVPRIGDDLREILTRLLGSPNICSRERVFRHYDSEVRGLTILRPGEADAGVVMPVPGCPAGVAVSVDGNPRLGLIDAYAAGACAVAESMRNVACVGAAPVALTDCLNFGSPEDPEVYGDLEEAVRGIADAARRLGRFGAAALPVPIVSGNVSLYNEGAARKAIPPSPIVVCVGTLPDVRRAPSMLLAAAGDSVLLVGGDRPGLGGSEYMALLGDPAAAPIADLDLDREREEIHAVIEAVRSGRVRAAHDLSSGGLLVGLVEMLLAREEDPLGLEVAAEFLPDPWSSLPMESLYFGEGAGFLLEVAAADRDLMMEGLRGRGVRVAEVGTVLSGPGLRVRRRGAVALEIGDADLRMAWEDGLRRRFQWSDV